MEAHQEPPRVKVLQVIMAHKQAQHTFDRNARFWEHHNCDTLVFCPKGEEVASPWPTIGYGQRQHHGPVANKRFKWLLCFLVKMHYTWTLLHEYDSFCLSPDLPIVDDPRFSSAEVIAGNVFRDDRPDRGFVGQSFIHPPLLFSHTALLDIAAMIETMPDWAEEGFWDRLLGFTLEQCNILPVDYLSMGLGYAKNTIETKDHPELVKAICGGAVFIHGVKDPQTLGVIMHAIETIKPQNLIA